MWCSVARAVRASSRSLASGPRHFASFGVGIRCILGSASLAVADAILVLAVGVRSRRIDKHPNLARRVHNIFTDRLFLFQGENDIVKSASAVDILVNIVALALVRNVIIVDPASKTFLDLQEKAVKDFVRIGFD